MNLLFEKVPRRLIQKRIPLRVHNLIALRAGRADNFGGVDVRVPPTPSLLRLERLYHLAQTVLRLEIKLGLDARVFRTY